MIGKWTRRARLYLTMVNYARAHNRDFAREHYEFFERMRRDLSPWFPSWNGLRVLDLGCGKSMWLTLLLHSSGARVTGIDTEAVDPGRTAGKYLAVWRRNGLERALRTLAWDVLYARPYYGELEKIAPFPLTFDELDARSIRVEDLDLPNGVLDLVVSHEVFEHLPDVDAVLEATHRLLKPGGIAYIYIHNFASLSGGHHIAWKYPDTEPSAVVPPWDHLRENRFPDIPSWINRLRVAEFRDAFARHFEILHWTPAGREGEALLTPEIRGELPGLSEEELLTKGYTAIVRRPVDVSEDLD